jgi:hypothetical protein
MPVKAAWNAILDALPARWRLDPPVHHPELDDWSATAVGGRRRKITGRGQDEIAALLDLALRLRAAGHSGDSCADELDRRARRALGARVAAPVIEGDLP